MRPFESSSTVVHPEYLSTDVHPCTSVEDKVCSKTPMFFVKQKSETF